MLKDRTLSNAPVMIIDPAEVEFAVSSTSARGQRVVTISGGLDIASRDLVCRACLEGNEIAVVVDIARLTFIDCSGYGALIAARRILTDLGGSLTIHNQAGQPARLLSLLSALEAAQVHH
jgi:anti-anti-sigma factor